MVGVGFDTSCKFAAYQEIESIMQWGGEAKLEPKHEQTVKRVSRYSSKRFKEEHLSVCLTVLFNRHLLKPIYHCGSSHFSIPVGAPDFKNVLKAETESRCVCPSSSNNCAQTSRKLSPETEDVSTGQDLAYRPPPATNTWPLTEHSGLNSQETAGASDSGVSKSPNGPDRCDFVICDKA